MVHLTTHGQSILARVDQAWSHQGYRPLWSVVTVHDDEVQVLVEEVYYSGKRLLAVAEFFVTCTKSFITSESKVLLLKVRIERRKPSCPV